MYQTCVLTVPPVGFPQEALLNPKVANQVLPNVYCLAIFFLVMATKTTTSYLRISPLSDDVNYCTFLFFHSKDVRLHNTGEQNKLCGLIRRR